MHANKTKNNVKINRLKIIPKPKYCLNTNSKLEVLDERGGEADQIEGDDKASACQVYDPGAVA